MFPLTLHVTADLSFILQCLNWLAFLHSMCTTTVPLFVHIPLFLTQHLGVTGGDDSSSHLTSPKPLCSLRAADRCVNWTFRSRHVKLAWRALWQSTPKPCEITGDCSWPSFNLKPGTHAKRSDLTSQTLAEAGGAGGSGCHHYLLTHKNTMTSG